MCVEMRERLPGQSPALDKLEAMIQYVFHKRLLSCLYVRETTTRRHVLLLWELQLCKCEGKKIDKPKNSIRNDSDEEKEVEKHEKDKEEYDEEDEEDGEDQGGKEGEEKDMEMADWVDVSSGGVDDGDWMMPNDIPSLAKDAGRLFLDAFRKL